MSDKSDMQMITNMGFPDGIFIQNGAMVFDDKKVTIEDIISTTRTLAGVLQKTDGMRKVTMWLIADTLNYGEKAFGEKYSQAIEDTGLSLGRLMNCCSAANGFDPKRRHLDLTIDHHLAVMKLTPRIQDKILEEASTEKLSVADTREKVRQLNGEPSKKRTKSKVAITVSNNFETSGQALDAAAAVAEWFTETEKTKKLKDFTKEEKVQWKEILSKLRSAGRRMGVMA